MNYDNLRRALDLGPTPGPWDSSTYMGAPITLGPISVGVDSDLDVREADEAFICAADPTTVESLLNERDALYAALESVAEFLVHLRDFHALPVKLPSHSRYLHEYVDEIRELLTILAERK